MSLNVSLFSCVLARPMEKSCHHISHHLFLVFLTLAHNGTKIILFGGRRGDALLGDLHILDVRTRIWTQERGVGPNDNRADMACSVAGDHFVVWGGIDMKDMKSLLIRTQICTFRSSPVTLRFSLLLLSSTYRDVTKGSNPCWKDLRNTAHL